MYQDNFEKMVRTEDYHFIKEGVPVKGYVEIVARIVRLNNKLGSDVADNSEARMILGI